MKVSTEFQRARRPEQQQLRRDAILKAAAEMLSEAPVNEISLRELSRRVGLAKSNVLRYFESREAVFLELLDRSWEEWLQELEVRMASEDTSGTISERCARVGGLIAATVAARPLMCELMAATAGVLERNISVAAAKRFKIAAAQKSLALGTVLRGHLPELDDAALEHFAGASFVLVAGQWPFNHPSEAVKQALVELQHPAAHMEFESWLREALTVHLLGLAGRASRKSP